PFAAGAISFLQGALFGGHSSPAPLHLTGQLQLTGTITEKSYLPEFFIQVPGAQHDNAADAPLYDEPIGIYNLVTKPEIKYAVEDHWTTCRYGGISPTLYKVADAYYHKPAVGAQTFVVNPRVAPYTTIKVATVPLPPPI